MTKTNGHNIRFEIMSKADWSNYLSHVVEANELYIQYGMNPSEELLEWIQNPDPAVFYYSIHSIIHDVMVGYVGVVPKSGNLEFYIFREYRRQGFGFEAIDMFSRMFFSGDITGKKENELVAETLTDNEPSTRLLEKAGFQKSNEGIRIQFNHSEPIAIGLCVYKQSRRRALKKTKSVLQTMAQTFSFVEEH